MSIHFQGAAPYNQQSWSTTSRDEALSNLEGAICSAKRLIAVGAGSDSIQVSEYPEALFIAADGAVGAIDDLSRVLCVVSDGDGSEHLEKAAKFGTHVVLHAHGDNTNIWKELVARWCLFEQPPPLTLTHQSDKYYQGMYNPEDLRMGIERFVLFKQRVVPFMTLNVWASERITLGHGLAPQTQNEKKQKLVWMEESMRRLGVEHQLIR